MSDWYERKIEHYEMMVDHNKKGFIMMAGVFYLALSCLLFDIISICLHGGGIFMGASTGACAINCLWLGMQTLMNRFDLKHSREMLTHMKKYSQEKECSNALSDYYKEKYHDAADELAKYKPAESSPIGEVCSKETVHAGG